MADTSFDLIVVGGGPGGYVAAIRAAQLGMKTAIVEREHMGGICLNWGCIPTKALLRTSRGLRPDQARRRLRPLGQGRVVRSPRRSSSARARSPSQLNNGVSFLMKKNKITVFDGTAKLAGRGRPRKLAVAMNDKSSATLTAKNVILATGARARELPGPGARRQAGLDLPRGDGAAGVARSRCW